MTTTPPTRVMMGSIRLNAWPAAVADAPRVMKTRRKPRMKRAAWSTAVRRAVAAEPSDSSSIVRPETKLKYAGTTGSTHGERNETNPARNAKGREILVASMSWSANRGAG